MIVQADFLDHWKTIMLCQILDDDRAPMYVLRLWAHCQNRRTHILPVDNPEAIRAICRAPQEAHVFYDAMISTGFIRYDGESLIAHDWDVVNSSLVKNWENGAKGGRPAKKTQSKPKQNPTVTQDKPNDNPNAIWVNPGETQAKPNDNPKQNWVNPNETDKIRVEKSREEEIGNTLKVGSAENFESQFGEGYQTAIDLWTSKREEHGLKTYSDGKTLDGARQLAQLIDSGSLNVDDMSRAMDRVVRNEDRRSWTLSAVANNISNLVNEEEDFWEI